MADLTLRRVKQDPLTHDELDDNFLALNGTFIDSNAPTNPHQGDMWLNRSVNRLYMWDGTVWFQEP